jgi:hypothetical protein
MSRAEPRELRRYRQFYLVYSRIWESLTPELRQRVVKDRHHRTLYPRDGVTGRGSDEGPRADCQPADNIREKGKILPFSGNSSAS